MPNIINSVPKLCVEELKRHSERFMDKRFLSFSLKFHVYSNQSLVKLHFLQVMLLDNTNLYRIVVSNERLSSMSVGRASMVTSLYDEITSKGGLR